MEFKEELKDDLTNLVKNIQKIFNTDEVVKLLKANQKTESLKNIHKEAKSVFPTYFTGTKISMSTSLNLNYIEKVNLVQEYSYGGDKKVNMYSQLLYNELEKRRKGSTLRFGAPPTATCTYKQVFADNVEMSLTTKIKDLAGSDLGVSFETGSKSFCGSMSVALTNLNPSTISFVWQWMEQISPAWMIGVEVGAKPFKQTTLLPDRFSFNIKYSNPSFILSSTMSKKKIQLCCFKRISNDVEVAAIFSACSPRIGLALRKTFDNQSEVKMFTDSKIGAGVTYEKKLFLQDKNYDTKTVRITISSIVDNCWYFKFGLGIHIDM